MISPRLAALLLSSAATLLIAAPGAAQVAPTPQQNPVDAAPTAADVGTPSDDPSSEEVVVTGSRIARPEVDQPNPIVSFSAATLD